MTWRHSEAVFSCENNREDSTNQNASNIRELNYKRIKWKIKWYDLINRLYMTVGKDDENTISTFSPFEMD